MNEKNKQEFLQLFDQYIGHRKGADSLRRYLESSDFFTAPASKQYHLAEEGGLCEHSLHVFYVLREMLFGNPGTTWQIYAEKAQITMESVAVVGLLHDICKTYFYDVELKNKKSYEEADIEEELRNGGRAKSDANGQYVWVTRPAYTINDRMPLGHGEKSCLIISKYMELTSMEMFAIRWHMGLSVPKEEWGMFNDAVDKYPLVLAAHLADMAATHLLEGSSAEMFADWPPKEEGEDNDSEAELLVS